MGISPLARRGILNKLLTSPERKALWNKTRSSIEHLLTEEERAPIESLDDILPPPERAYLFGSFTTKKKAPSDIDILARYGEEVPGSAFQEGAVAPGRALNMEGIHFVPYSLHAEGGDPGLEDIVREGRKRYGKEWKLIRILGLTGALGGSGIMSTQEGSEGDKSLLSNLLSPSNAEAFPIGKFVSKKVSGPISSAARRLIGHEISGMTIKNVIKGKEPWRYITFEGTEQVLPVTKDIINDIARQFGTTVYTGEAERVGGAKALQMAIKSAEMRLRLKGSSPYTAQEVAALEAQHVGNIKELELEPHKMVQIIYSGAKIKIPKIYADLLTTNGLAKLAKE